MADVNAIQPATPEQKSSKMGPAVASTVVLGGLGAAGGYFMGGKRPSLEEVFKQQPDKFVAKEVTDIDSESAKKLSDAVEEYKGAGTTEKAAFVDTAKDRFNAAKAEMGKDTEEGKALVKARGEMQTAAENAIKKITIEDPADKTKTIQKYNNFAQLKTKLDAAKDEVKAAGENATEDQKKALKELQEDYKKVLTDSDVVTKMKAYGTAYKTSYKKALETLKDNDAVTKFNDAKKAYNKVKTDKLSEILGRDDIKTAFEKIKKAFPKEGKGKAAAIYGGIAAAVGLIAGLMMGGKKPVEAAPADAAAQPAPDAPAPVAQEAAPVQPAPAPAADATAQAPAPTAPAAPEPAKA